MAYGSSLASHLAFHWWPMQFWVRDQEAALRTETGWERTASLQLSDWGRFGYQRVLQTSGRDIPQVFSDES